MFFNIIRIFICCVSFSVWGDTIEEAKKPVETLNEVLIEVMKHGTQLGYQGRYEKLAPVVKEVFEFEAVSQIALGSHWKKLIASQKLDFMNILTDLSIATYAAQFNGHSGEVFKYDSNQDLKNTKMLLSYYLSIPKSKEKPIKFDYILGYFGKEWKIINIIVDGISDLALKKAQYTSIIEKDGFDSLLDKIRRKITDYADDKNTLG